MNTYDDYEDDADDDYIPPFDDPNNPDNYDE